MNAQTNKPQIDREVFERLVRKRLTEIRARSGRTLADTSKATGFSVPAVSGYERGLWCPGALYLRRFADAFGVKVQDIIY